MICAPDRSFKPLWTNESVFLCTWSFFCILVWWMCHEVWHSVRFDPLLTCFFFIFFIFTITNGRASIGWFSTFFVFDAMPCFLLPLRIITWVFLFVFGMLICGSQTDVSVACISVRGLGHKALAFSQGMPPSACLQNNVAPHQVNHVRKTFFLQISTVFHRNSLLNPNSL